MESLVVSKITVAFTVNICKLEERARKFGTDRMVVANFTKNKGFSVSQEIFVVGIIFQNVCSPKAVGPAAPSFGKIPMTRLEVQGPFGDGVENQKFLKFKI